MSLNIDQETSRILSNIASKPSLSPFVDFKLPIPCAHRGIGEIKLIILGQDPTIENEHSRRMITEVLKLNKPGKLRDYISRICHGLELDLDMNIYATNYLKNFFIDPPTKIKEIDVFKEFAPYWLPLLKEELAEFPQVPIITLGKPVLSMIVCQGASFDLKEYWGYKHNWKLVGRGEFRYIAPSDNCVKRHIFPFPHQQNNYIPFFSKYFEYYLAFTKKELGL